MHVVAVTGGLDAVAIESGGFDQAGRLSPVVPAAQPVRGEGCGLLDADPARVSVRRVKVAEDARAVLVTVDLKRKLDALTSLPAIGADIGGRGCLGAVVAQRLFSVWEVQSQD